MVVFSCSECRFRFEALAAGKCPRCASESVSAFGSSEPVGRSIRDGKEGWRDFHSQQATKCPHCGGVEFELNYKRKEKVCKKCGEVMPLPRRFS